MTIGSEIPFRRSKREHDTGSLVFDQERRTATAADATKAMGSDKRQAAPKS